MGSERVSFDLSRPGIILLTLEGQLNDADYTHIMDECERILEVAEEHVFIADAGAVTTLPSASQRALLGERMRRLRPLADRASVATVVVARSMLLRSVMSILTWISPSRRRRYFASSRPEALARAEQILASHRRGSMG